MSAMSFITSLISIGSWIENPLMAILLFFDARVFWLISYAYNLFILMCTINYNSLYGIISNILDELQAVVMVFVVFKVGISLITYMFNPEKASKEGSKILVNIFITAALLMSYNFIFTVFSELGMLVVGNPAGTPYVVLGQLAEVTGGKDEGLIMRAVFSKSPDTEEVGDFLAYSMASVFIHDYGYPDSSEYLRKEICDETSCDFMKLPNLANKVGKKVEYHYLISFICGVFMVVCIVKTSIQIGIRMFKLLILQILAPVAIISIVGEGIKAKIFQNYLKKFTSVFLEAFTRMFTMLIVTVFVCKFFINVKDYFPTVNSDNGTVTFLITVLIIVAAYKFAGDIPGFIDEILGTKLGSTKGGNFVGGLLGAGLGAAGGLIGGFAGGGLGGALAGAVKGGVGGAQSGSKGNSVAEFFKGQKANVGSQKTLGQTIRSRGGLVQAGIGGVQTAVGVGSHQDRRLAKLDLQSKKLDEYAAAQSNAIKELKSDAKDTVLGGKTVGSAYVSGYEDIKFGEDKSAYAAQMIEYDKDYIDAQSKLAEAESAGVAGDIQVAREKLETTRAMATKRAEDYYTDRLNNLEVDARTDPALRKDITAKREAYVAAGGKMQQIPDKNNNVKTEKQDIYKRRAAITNTKSYARTHGQNPNNK